MKVAVCSTVKNENIYLVDWVLHYLKLGFTNVLIFDNNDDDGENPYDVLGKYIDEGYVKYVDVRGLKGKDLIKQNGTNVLMLCFDLCYNVLFKDLYDWIAFYDVDEYLVLKKDTTILSYLSRECFNDKNIILINLRMMTAYNQIYYEQKPVFERFPVYGDCENNLRVFKTIIRANKGFTVNFNFNPHVCYVYKGNEFINIDDLNISNSSGEKVFEHDDVIKITHDGKVLNDSHFNFLYYYFHDKSYVKFELAEIRHYFTKSLQEYLLRRIVDRIDNIKNRYNFFILNNLFFPKNVIYQGMQVLPKSIITTFFYSLTHKEYINQESEEYMKYIKHFLDLPLHKEFKKYTIGTIVVAMVLQNDTEEDIEKFVKAYYKMGFNFILLYYKSYDLFVKLQDRNKDEFSIVASYMVDHSIGKSTVFTSELYRLKNLFDWILYVNSLKDIMDIGKYEDINSLILKEYEGYDIVRYDLPDGSLNVLIHPTYEYYRDKMIALLFVREDLMFIANMNFDKRLETKIEKGKFSR